MQIRRITENDSEKPLILNKQLDHETKFMMFEPDERKTSVKQQQEQIQSILSSGNSMIFVAEHEHELIGFLSARGGIFRRTSTKVHIVIGILQAYIGQGVGTALFNLN